MRKKILASVVLLGILLIGLSGLVNATNATVWYQSSSYYTYNMYVNSTTGYSSSDSSLEDNWIALSAHVDSVARVSDYWEYVIINISAAAYSKATKTATTYYDNGMPVKTSTTLICPDKIKIFASQSNVPDNLKISFQYEDNSGVNVTGDKYQGSKVDKYLRDATEFAMDQIISSVPYLGLTYSTAKFLYNELSPTGVENMYGKAGSGTAWESFYFENDKIEWTENHHYWGSQKDEYISYGHAIYSASASILWKIPVSQMNTYTLTIGAQNIIGMWVDFAQPGSKDGASSSVTITIKNGKISSFNAYTDNVNDSAGNTFYTKDYTPWWVSDPNEYYAAPTLIVEATTLNNVPLNYKVEWGDGAYSYAYGHSSGEQYSFSHKYYPGGEGATRYYTIKVTAYTDGYYGGWSKTQQITIEVVNNGKMDDDNGPGGGACPFIYTYNGTWREENNVLVWAENATRENIETRDYYLLRNLQEINGKIEIGIGEFGEDVDFIDDVKLYKVNVPNGYNVVESYNGKVYEYKDFEVPERAEDSNGHNVSYLINSEDNNYWVGDKGEYVDVYVNLSKKNLLLFRGVDNPPSGEFSPEYHLPVTLSTIWLYGNFSGNWVKLKEIKVRHNLHTVAINMNKLIHKHKGTIELRFVMRDRNGIDFIGIAHEFRKAGIKRVKLMDASRGIDNLRYRDGWYLKINPGGFVSLDFKGKGSGTYLVRVDGFYFNEDKIGKGIGIVRENETNIAEAELQENITSSKEYVLLPLLNNYSGICEITWFVDGYYLPGEKPVVEFSSGDHFIELWILRYNGTIEQYGLYINVS